MSGKRMAFSINLSLIFKPYFKMKGIIFDIKHYAIHDGPGIRQTIFLKGCPLSCWWCHNPESQSKDPFTYIKKEKMDGKVISFPETVGYSISSDDLLKEILKDLMFFEESGGGVTFSGGEPILQFEFLKEILLKCKKHEINTCVDTTGFVSQKKLMEIAELTDLFLFDIKHMNTVLHKKFTGVPNELILSNLKKLDEAGVELWIRYPLIPGFNDDESNLFRMIAFLNNLIRKPKLSILPYHKIGSNKYSRFDIPYRMNGTPEPKEEEIQKVKNLFEGAGYTVSVGG